MDVFEVEIEGFSGPLELLCSLLESGELDASLINAREIVSAYWQFLHKSGRTSLDAIAEFLILAAHLLLSKAKALIPPVSDAVIEEEEENTLPPTESLLPYRIAVDLLAKKFAERQRFFNRPPEEGSPVFEVGDVYLLSAMWWGLYAEKNHLACRVEDKEGWEGIPMPIPEEEQVEKRIAEVCSILKEKGRLFLGDLLAGRRSRSYLVVTLLALLELCRLGRISLSQEGRWSDVAIALR
ncbi:segregation/condensation protein A [Acetomicrobium sp. S15 = DSM 107314]|uniref:segregation/condensation protein A n=1 Tax=Acetomicrobium sp. S15 = DSM 107314 TaxID=2529858 RepID=UPI001E2E95C9|nr:segregation/condensation protein A [Acetomicrobium sp. S15 = DSM 107314]